MRRAGLVLTILVVLSFTAWAADKEAVPPPNQPLHTLIANAAVQADLKLADDQKKAINDATAEAREALKGVNQLPQAERQKKQQEVRTKLQGVLDKTLKDEQKKRFKQIDLQQRGPLVINQKEVADQLELTNDQKKKVFEINQQTNQAIAKLREDNKGKELTTKIGKARAEAGPKVIETLTDAQKAKWKTLVGEPFDLAKLQTP